MLTKVESNEGHRSHNSVGPARLVNEDLPVSRISQTPSLEQEYSRLVGVLIKLPNVSQPIGKKGFGSSGLYISGKLFAFLSYKKQLVLKLPSDRVNELTAGGEGTRFDPRRDGRGMKEWFVLNPSSRMEWLPLAKEAMKFQTLSNDRKN